MCKSLKQVINFQGDGPCLGTWNKESKQYTWLSYNQVGSSFFSLHSFFILFFCNYCKKNLIITIKKPGHRLTTKKVGSSIQVKPVAVRGEEARNTPFHLTHRSFVFSSFRTSSQLSHGYEKSPLNVT